MVVITTNFLGTVRFDVACLSSVSNDPGEEPSCDDESGGAVGRAVPLSAFRG